MLRVPILHLILHPKIRSPLNQSPKVRFTTPNQNNKSISRLINRLLYEFLKTFLFFRMFIHLLALSKQYSIEVSRLLLTLPPIEIWRRPIPHGTYRNYRSLILPRGRERSQLIPSRSELLRNNRVVVSSGFAFTTILFIFFLG